MKIELTEAQANLLRYAAEYKLEQDEEGDGMPKVSQRRALAAAVEKLRAALHMEPGRYAREAKPVEKRCSSCKERKPDVRRRQDPYEKEINEKKVYLDLCDACDKKIGEEV